MIKNINTIILWGALWGIEEATVGQLLHLTALNIGWIIWFPLAWFFMNQVWKRTQSPFAVLVTASVSAAIKLTDLISEIPAQYVVCPALSILLEGLMVFAAVKLLRRNNIIKWNHIGGIMLGSLAWRALYLAAVALIPPSVITVYPYSDSAVMARFILLEGAVNGLLICGGILFVGCIRRYLTDISFVNTTLGRSSFLSKPVLPNLFSAGVLVFALTLQALI